MATHGYQLFRCGPAYPVHTWCGNAGWFPGYPGLLVVLYALGLPHAATAVVVAWLFALATLILLWNGFLRAMGFPSRYLGLALAAYAPGAIYTRAAYPISMAAFFIVLCFLLLRRDRTGLAALSGAVAAFCYPTAAVMAPVVALHALGRSEEGGVTFVRRLAPAMLAGIGVGAGFLAALAVMWMQTGALDAYFRIQAKYHHGLLNPIAQFIDNARAAVAGPGGLGVVPALEATFVGLLVLTLLVAVCLRGSGVRLMSRHELVTLAAIAALWLAPLAQSNVATYRTDALLFPVLAIVADQLPVALAGLALAVSGTLFVFLSLLFFRGVLT